MEPEDKNNNFSSKAINDLCFDESGRRYRFHIPSYQRGYRWTTHVKKLLDDIYKYSEDKTNGLNVGAYYCLQPIVLKRRPDLDYSPENGKPEIGYEVVDGQQRLTTVLILLTVFGHHKEDGIFRISYQRDNIHEHELEREKYLESIDKANNDEMKKNSPKADFYYINDAYINARTWLEEKTQLVGPKLRNKFMTTLLEEVKIIWYLLPDHEDGRLHFRTINAGKIKLTDSELVKAMILNSRHYQVKDYENSKEKLTKSLNDLIRREQEKIATVWDTCERTMQNQDFWSFISCDDRPLSERMNFLLELYIKHEQKTNEQGNDIVTIFEPILEDKNKVPNEWLGIRELFRKLQDMFGDIKLYNYIGLLTQKQGSGTRKYVSLMELLNKSAELPKSEFHKWLVDKVQCDIGLNIDNIELWNYYDNREMIKWALMYFNIKLMNNLGRRFNFVVEGGWSVEHVFARHSQRVKEAERNDWIDRHLHIVESVLNKCDKNDVNLKNILELKNQMEQYNGGDDFNGIFDRYLILIEGQKVDLDTIGNLALLGFNDNAALSNDMFYYKREKIINMLENKHNIPVGSERIFMKSFPNIETSLEYWSSEDGKLYLRYMKDILRQVEDN